MPKSPQENADELAEDFEFLESWDDRLEYLFDIARNLPPMDPDAKIEANLVHGCQSNVWLVPHLREEGACAVIDFEADSDALITKGLIALLYRVYSGQTPESILKFDVEGFLERLELGQHLSMTRRNGLHGMVQRIKTLATQANQQPAL